MRSGNVFAAAAARSRVSRSGDDAEPWPDEPETGWPNEPDQEVVEEPAEFDPESLGPDVPSPPGRGSADNPAAVQLFWKLVLVFNVALLALAVGPMFAVFQGQWELGLQIFLVGALAFAYGTFRYYRFRTDEDPSTGD